MNRATSNDLPGSSLNAQHRWLEVGATEKAHSIRQLTEGLSISTLLEVGSGTGALLAKLDEMEFADEYYALEPSSAAMQYMQRHVPIRRLVAADAETLEKSKFREKHFDLVVLSHVLEHLDSPAKVLNDALEIADYVAVEVPLDGSFSGNLRASVKRLLTGLPRHNNPAGHIQYFSSDDVSRLAYWNGGEIIRTRLYAPPYPTFATSRIKRTYLRGTKRLEGLFGNERWAKLYHGHYAVLIRRRPEIPSDERTRWTPFYFYEDIEGSPATQEIGGHPS